MPLKLNVGITKKVGLPDYGSLGASCYLELDLDSSLVEGDLAGFHERVRRNFAACVQAVDDELDRRGNDVSPSALERLQQPSNGRTATSRTNGTHRNGTSHQTAARNGSAVRATAKQMDYAQQLAGEIEGLGVRRLEALANKMFGKPLVNLNSLDASGLIDTLKAIKAGQVDLDAALSGAAA